MNEVVAFVFRKFADSPDRKSVRILDLGCGGGNHLLFLAQEGYAYYGVDGADEAVEVSKARLSQAGFSSERISRATFESLPFEPDFFDAVIDRGSLTCNRLADLPPLYREVERILKPGGYLFTALLNVRHSARDNATHLGDNDYTDFGGRLEGAGVLHFTDTQEAKTLVSDFDVESVRLLVDEEIFPGDGANRTVAWTFVVCAKRQG